MNDDLTIGLPFNLDEGWMGGAYYYQNMLHAFSTLPPDKQPRIVVITEDAASFSFLQQTGYPRLYLSNGHSVALGERFLGVHILFAYALPNMESRTLSWVPDFQERHLRYLFTEDEVASRTAWHQRCLQTAGVLLSSKSAHEDLLAFYEATEAPVFVVPFATFLPEDRPSIERVRERYGLPSRYFFLPNQFWIHKNHVVILAALRALAARGIRPEVCLSGKEHDDRAVGYAEHLRELTDRWGLTNQVHFLGFLPREDQITVMDNAVAVIQPSRFEGWSTVIEDAKALDMNIIASDLDVHRQQLGPEARYFHPSDYIRVASLLEEVWNGARMRRAGGYPEARIRYGVALLNVFSALARANPLPEAPQHERRDAADDVIEMRAGGGGERFLGLGWAVPEHTHVWSTGPRSELLLPPLEGVAHVRLALAGNPHAPGGRQVVRVSINGEPTAEIVALDGREFEIVIASDATAWLSNRNNSIGIEVDPPAIPPPQAGDKRLLGVCLLSISFDR